MTEKEREEAIEYIVSHGPLGPSTADDVKASLSRVPDEQLGLMRERLEFLEAHVSRSAVARPDVSDKREKFAARRAARYERIAALAGQAEGARAKVEDVPAQPRASLPDAAPGRVPEPHLADIRDAVRLWNQYERRQSPLLAGKMRDLVYCWLDDFGKKALHKPGISTILVKLLEDPLREVFDQYLELAVDRVGWDTLRVLRNHLARNPNLAAVFDRDLGFHLLGSALASDALETVFVGSADGRMRETAAIDGLARMRAFALRYVPDVVVAASEGGSIVGDFIAVETKIDGHRTRRLEGHGRTVRISGGWKSLRGFGRILLVDDLADSPDRLNDAGRQLALHIDGEVQMMALASSLGTREKLIAAGHANLFVAHVADNYLGLPWDRTGGYTMNTKSHVFCHGREGSLSVAKAQMRRVSTSLE